MIDTPDDALDDGQEDPVENKPPGTQSEHRRPRRRSKPHRPRENTASTRKDNTLDNEDPVEVESKQEEQESGQDSPNEQATYGDSEDNNYLPPSKEEEILDHEDFIVPKEPLE